VADDVDLSTYYVISIREYDELKAEIERLRQWGIFADEYLPSMMALPGSTALRN